MWGLRIVKRRRRRRSKRTSNERVQYASHKETARAIIHERVAHWCERIGVTPGRIAIRDQRSRWGSCSTKGNLNFNYRVVSIPVELVDYLVVHELCHLIEFNHSPQFWDRVASHLPDYVLRKQALKEVSLMTRGNV